jgi:large subunit ribosomal protein L15
LLHGAVKEQKNCSRGDIDGWQIGSDTYKKHDRPPGKTASDFEGYGTDETEQDSGTQRHVFNARHDNGCISFSARQGERIMRLNELKPAKGAKKKNKRLGRGVGSGQGKTAGRGTKGQNSRSGGGVRPGYEGGQMPIHRRLPKRGFTNIFKKQIAIVNIRDLSQFESDTVIDEKQLLLKGIIKGKNDGVKLLGQGDISYPLTIQLDGVSNSAREKIEAAGGSIQAKPASGD